MKKNALVILGALLPYLAVIIGLYIFHHAYIALLLYHSLIWGYMYTQKRYNIFEQDTQTKEVKKSLWTKYIVFVLITACSGPLVYTYIRFLQPYLQKAIKIPPLQLFDYLAYYQVFSFSIPLFIVYFGIVHPLIEQKHWRALFYHINLNHDKKMGIILHLLFALYHIVVLYTLMPFPILLLVFWLLFFVSIIWNYFMKHNISFTYLLVSHIITDTSMVIGVAIIYVR